MFRGLVELSHVVKLRCGRGYRVEATVSPQACSFQRTGY